MKDGQRIKIKDMDVYYVGIIKHGNFRVSLEAGHTQISVQGYHLADEDGEQIVDNVNETIALIDQYYEIVGEECDITPNKLKG